MKKLSEHKAWTRTLVNVSAWVEEHLCEEGIELTGSHQEAKWTIHTIDEHLYDHVDEVPTSMRCQGTGDSRTCFL